MKPQPAPSVVTRAQPECSAMTKAQPIPKAVTKAQPGPKAVTKAQPVAPSATTRAQPVQSAVVKAQPVHNAMTRAHLKKATSVQPSFTMHQTVRSNVSNMKGVTSKTSSCTCTMALPRRGPRALMLSSAERGPPISSSTKTPLRQEVIHSDLISEGVLTSDQRSLHSVTVCPLSFSSGHY